MNVGWVASPAIARSPSYYSYNWVDWNNANKVPYSGKQQRTVTGHHWELVIARPMFQPLGCYCFKSWFIFHSLSTRKSHIILWRKQTPLILPMSLVIGLMCIIYIHTTQLMTEWNIFNLLLVGNLSVQTLNPLVHSNCQWHLVYASLPNTTTAQRTVQNLSYWATTLKMSSWAL